MEKWDHQVQKDPLVLPECREDLECLALLEMMQMEGMLGQELELQDHLDHLVLRDRPGLVECLEWDKVISTYIFM